MKWSPEIPSSIRSVLNDGVIISSHDGLRGMFATAPLRRGTVVASVTDALTCSVEDDWLTILSKQVRKEPYMDDDLPLTWPLEDLPPIPIDALFQTQLTQPEEAALVLSRALTIEDVVVWAPGLDFANHGPPLLYPFNAKGVVGLVLGEDVEEGTPLTLDYGVTSNDVFFTNFGFVVPDLKTDDYKFGEYGTLLRNGVWISDVVTSQEQARAICEEEIDDITSAVGPMKPVAAQFVEAKLTVLNEGLRKFAI